ncbi:MAG: hypothetical protein RL603_1874 [Pseudomonadota bacterium]|jgi:hypothetical protein
MKSIVKPRSEWCQGDPDPAVEQVRKPNSIDLTVIFRHSWRIAAGARVDVSG